MKKVSIGNTDIQGSALVLGTWAIGGSEWGGANEAESIQAIHTAIDEGINFIDTAPIYGQGLAEEVVGKVIKERSEELVIATKVGLRWDCEDGEFNFEAGDGTRIYKNLKPDSIRLEVERSLKRLGIESIDLLQTHWPDSTTSVAETMGCLLELKQEGKIKAIGACNLDLKLLEAYQAAGTLDSIQEMYSMLDRDLEKDLLPAARKNEAATLAYSPLAMGLLTGKIGPERHFGEGDIRSWSPRFSVGSRQQVAGLLDCLQPFAEKYEVTLAQLVIAWTLHQRLITHVLSGARKPSQAKENAVGGKLDLAATDVGAIDQIIDEFDLKIPHPFKG